MVDFYSEDRGGGKKPVDVKPDIDVWLQHCPLGKTRGFCIESVCDRRKQCHKEKVINEEYDFDLTPYLRSCKMEASFPWEK